MHDKKELQLRNKITQGILKNLRNKKWRCLYDQCPDDCINSHILQRHGILDNVTVNNHLIELKSKDPFKRQQGALFEFKTRGLNESFSFDLLCSSHDTNIFKPIETVPLDCTNYQHQVLLLYRAVCAEIRKKEMANEFSRRWLQSSSISLDSSEEFLYHEQIVGHNKGIAFLEVYKQLIEKEITNPTGDIVFFHSVYPLNLQIFSSSIFEYDPLFGTNAGQRKLANNIPWDAGFVNILPFADETHILLGYHKSYANPFLNQLCSSWSGLTYDDLGNKLTELFAGHVEGWGLSPDLYKRLKPQNIDIFLRYMSIHGANSSFNQIIGTNLFEGAWS